MTQSFISFATLPIEKKFTFFAKFVLFIVDFSLKINFVYREILTRVACGKNAIFRFANTQQIYIA